jgi:hypothetical protein
LFVLGPDSRIADCCLFCRAAFLCHSAHSHKTDQCFTAVPPAAMNSDRSKGLAACMLCGSFSHPQNLSWKNPSRSGEDGRNRLWPAKDGWDNGPIGATSPGLKKFQ